jgi:3,4-dihydroxy 2-butanone 4-phosphate synthase/GTP cyclohydrolase II
LGTLTNNADQQVDDMFKAINDEGKGAVIFYQSRHAISNLLNRLLN